MRFLWLIRRGDLFFINKESVVCFPSLSMIENIISMWCCMASCMAYTACKIQYDPTRINTTVHAEFTMQKVMTFGGQLHAWLASLIRIMFRWKPCRDVLIFACTCICTIWVHIYSTRCMCMYKYAYLSLWRSLAWHCTYISIYFKAH